MAPFVFTCNLLMVATILSFASEDVQGASMEGERHQWTLNGGVAPSKEDIAACKGLVQKKTAEESFPVCTAKALCPDSSWTLKMWNFGGAEAGSCYKFITPEFDPKTGFMISEKEASRPKTWWNAKRDCEKRGAHLVTINSQRENDFILQLIKEALPVIHHDYDKFSWIGAYCPESDDGRPLYLDDKFPYGNPRLAKRNAWIWIQDGEQLTGDNMMMWADKTMYYAGQGPFGHYDTITNFARIDNKNGKWSPINRGLGFPYICETNLGPNVS